MLAATGISKRFGRVLALDNAALCALYGEIHALVGENGAGKSTLINILTGRIAPDSGRILIDGAPLASGSPSAAIRAGIAAVYQSPMLFERMAWEENLALGGIAAGYSAAESLARARSIASGLGFRLPPPGAIVESRAIGDRVRLEILRALLGQPRVLLLDEPTGALPPNEVGPFLDLLGRLRDGGRAVILVTHKLGEALAAADRVTVLRRGCVTTQRLASELDADELARLMIGDFERAPAPASMVASTEPVLEVENLLCDYRGRRALDGVSLTLGRGEIAGIAGVDGNGQDELAEILAGARKPSGGRFRVPDAHGPAAGSIAVIPQNRDVDGLVLRMSLWENLLLARPLRERLSRRGCLARRRAANFCAGVIDRLRIRTDGPGVEASSLSGGNRQRLMIARAP
ncbi:MAG TPA: ATP-binding cassette domain-containing protein, partial [Candidatus Binataceae bacterium]|nr:ATP-binding cassette domain-containing protein [Candidatus Binataceae bacterium]